MIDFKLKDDEGNEAKSSPWLYDALCNHLSKVYWSDLRRDEEMNTGVYKSYLTVRNYMVWTSPANKLANLVTPL